jgi:hypothetical protein
MPHLQQPMELNAGISWHRRLLRLAFIAAFTGAVFILAFAVVVVATTP